MPMTASPLPYSRPSSRLAAMPEASSVGWLGCKRVDSRCCRPMVLRKAVTTRHFLATRIRSWTRMILQTAADISGVMPGAAAASAAASASSLRSQLRKSPTVRWRSGANASASWLSMIKRVTSSFSYGTSTSLRNVANGSADRVICAATLSSALAAATPAR
jgi:hypothetical protein